MHLDLATLTGSDPGGDTSADNFTQVSCQALTGSPVSGEMAAIEFAPACL